MKIASTFLALAVAALVSACGGGGGGGETPAAMSIDSAAGVYSSDNTNAMLVVNPNGTIWTLGANGSTVGISTGDVQVASSGLFSGAGTSYLLSPSQNLWDRFSVSGQIDGSHMTYSAVSFGGTSNGTATRNNNFTGNIPPMTRVIPSAALTSTTIYALNTTTFTFNRSSVTGSVGSCTFSGSIADTGKGFANMSIRFANTSYCTILTNQTVNGIVAFRQNDNTLIYMLRQNVVPYPVVYGVSTLSKTVAQSITTATTDMTNGEAFIETAKVSN